MEVKKICPFCGKETTIELNTMESILLDSGALVQQAMLARNAFEREVIVSGMCFECQSKTYNAPIPGVDDWGEELGECEVCVCYLWEKHDINEAGEIVCPKCHTAFTRER